MHGLTFVWDERKDRVNQRKHGVSFDEARTVSTTRMRVSTPTPDHSEDEERFILLGISGRLRVLVVCHCYRESESVIRIISARRAQRNEGQTYWSQRS